MKSLKLTFLMFLSVLGTVSGCSHTPPVFQFYGGEPRLDAEVATIYVKNHGTRAEGHGCIIRLVSGGEYGPYTNQLKVLPGPYTVNIALASLTYNASYATLEINVKAGKSYTCGGYFSGIGYETKKPLLGIGFSSEELTSGTWTTYVHEFDPQINSKQYGEWKEYKEDYYEK